jgi:hypothetical protein
MVDQNIDEFTRREVEIGFILVGGVGDDRFRWCGSLWQSTFWNAIGL